MDKEEILEMIKKGEMIHKMGSLKIVKISEDVVVKFGSMVSKVEAESMRLISENTNILTPRLIMFFEEERKSYIVMEYVRGTSLDKCWKDLGIYQKVRILMQIAGHIYRMRRLRRNCPGTVLNSLNVGPWFTDYGSGPFGTSEELSSWLNGRIEVSERLKKWKMGKLRFETEREFVFTHQDISMRNFILDKDFRLWIIDWELSGFYPKYFEYSSTTFNKSGSWMWDTIVPIISGYYPTYYKMLDNLRFVLIKAPFLQ